MASGFKIQKAFSTVVDSSKTITVWDSLGAFYFLELITLTFFYFCDMCGFFFVPLRTAVIKTKSVLPINLKIRLCLSVVNWGFW